MIRRQPAFLAHAPAIWLVSDARNDARLEHTLTRLPRGSGIVFRHYHLLPAERHARFRRLAAVARRHGHRVVLAGTARAARRWRADGRYGGPVGGRAAGLNLVTAHSLREIGQARRAGADAVVISPVFATRSHPGARPLGPLRFRLLAARAGLPVIALGGMTAGKARQIGTAWAAIDGIRPNRDQVGRRILDAESPPGALSRADSGDHHGVTRNESWSRNGPALGGAGLARGAAPLAPPLG